MKVAFLTPSVSRALGGIYEVERNLAQALERATSTSVEVIGLKDQHTEQDVPAWAPIQPEVLSVRGPAAFGYSPELVESLLRIDADLVHLHALWMYTSVAALRWKRRTGRPHVVTVHGMLDSWALNNSRWKKRVAGWLYENANLREAACLQVFNRAEYRAVRAYGIETPVCVIPNGVTLPIEEISHQPPWDGRIPGDQRVLLFLGRLHPKKGLSELIDAWKYVKRDAPAKASEWTLAVVGWDDGGHEERLRQKVKAAGLNDVHFLGPIFGSDKKAAFQHADAFILPSFSEGLPMAVLEAWSYRLPVLMTPACNLPEGFEQNAACEIEPEARSITEGLSQLFRLTTDERAGIGHQGRALVEQRFTWPRIAEEMHAVYQWTLGAGPQPDCVQID